MKGRGKAGEGGCEYYHSEGKGFLTASDAILLGGGLGWAGGGEGGGKKVSSLQVLQLCSGQRKVSQKVLQL